MIDPGTCDESRAVGFERALEAFVADAAQRYGTTPDEIAVIPETDDPIEALQADSRSGTIEASLGRAWAFEAGPANDLDTFHRGWALDDGTVITEHQNVGALFEAAGTWSPEPSADITDIAARLVWSFGNAYHLDYRSPRSLELDARGAGKAAFFYTVREHTWEARFEATVTLEADHTATLESSDNVNR